MSQPTYIENWKLCDYKYCPQWVRTTIDHHLSIKQPVETLLPSLQAIFDTKVARQLFQIISEHQEDIQAVDNIFGNSVYVLLNFGLSRVMITKHLYQAIDLDTLVFMNFQDVLHEFDITVNDALKIYNAAHFALHKLVDDSNEHKQRVLRQDIIQFFTGTNDTYELNDIKEHILWRSGDKLLLDILTDLVKEQSISVNSHGLYTNISFHPEKNLSQAIEAIQDLSIKEQVLLRLQGQSTDTRALKQQWKQWGTIQEDMYKSLILKYNMDQTMFYAITDAPAMTWAYLQARYGQESSRKQRLDVNGWTLIHKLGKELVVNPDKLCDYLSLHYFEYNHMWISKDNRNEFLRAVCRSFDGYFSNDEVVQRFNEALNAHNPSKYFEWKLDDFPQSMASRQGYIVRSIKRGFRYRKISADLVLSIMQEIQLSQYEDTIISTKKIFEDHIETMEKYDIRDQYELHSLLRTGKEKFQLDVNDMVVAHIPMLQFGQANEEEIIKNEIYQLSPIDIFEFVSNMSDKYGYEQATLLSYMHKNFSMYIKDRILNVVGQDVMESDDFQTLKEALVFDFYSQDELEALFHEHHIAQTMLDPYVLRRLGYRTYVGYILKESLTASKYFESQIRKDPNFIHTYASIRSLNYIIYHMEQRLELFETKKDTYQTRQDLGLSVEQLIDIRNACINQVEETEYFNEKTLHLTYSNTFLKSLFKGDPNISMVSCGSTWVFKKGKTIANTKGLLTTVIEKHPGLTLSTCMSNLAHTYGIQIEKGDLIDRCKENDIYYSLDTEKMYLTPTETPSFTQERLF